MFRADESRKRVRRRSLDPSKSQHTPSTTTRRRLSVDAPLRGVVVCLTGLPADEKTKLHRQVDLLGGRYSRDLDTSTTTHLIAQTPEGAKYEAAVACPSILVVSPTWLHTCVKTGARADERRFSWVPHDDDEDAANVQDELSFGNNLEELLERNERSSLFSSCRFLLIGFDERESDQLVRNKLSKLIRRGMGTIYWELNEMITHIIVNTDCADSLRDAARTVSMHHPMGPVSVSPSWIVSSCKSKHLLSPLKFPPRKTIKKHEPTSNVGKPTTEGRSRRLSAPSDLFRGCVFALMRLSPPPDGVDFDSGELEQIVLQQGAQMLSPKLLEGLKLDQSRGEQAKRKCYVVCWGGYAPSHIAVHPLLSQIQRNDVCTIVPVSPVWLQVCVMDKKVTDPARRPLLFQPQTWPTRRLPDTLSSTAKGGGIKVAVTGFTGSERTGIVCLLRSIGATYTENMRSSNTHLICKESAGPKFDKATQWKLHVVSLNWLYHIAQYGYGGKGGSKGEGCESRFSSVATKSKEAESIADLPSRLEERQKMKAVQASETTLPVKNSVPEKGTSDIDDAASQLSQEIPETEPDTYE